MDIEPNHLKILARRLYEEMPEKMECVKLIEGGIPSKELDGLIEKESYDAILVDSVLHFMTPEEILEACQQFYTWLKPGRKIFASAATFYISAYPPQLRDVLEREVEKFIQSVKSGSEIDPKSIPFSNDFIGKTKDNTDPKFLMILQRMLEKGMKRFFSFHKETIRYFFEKAGFEVEEVFWTTIEGFEYALDGREYVGLVAKKPEK